MMMVLHMLVLPALLLLNVWVHCVTTGSTPLVVLQLIGVHYECYFGTRTTFYSAKKQNLLLLLAAAATTVTAAVAEPS